MTSFSILLAPQLWTISPGEFKQRATISPFKSDVRKWIYNECPCRLCKGFVPNLGFIWGTAPNLVLNIYHRFFNACIYIYIYMYLYVSPSKEMHIQLGIYWYFLLFDMYLPTSTHFINLDVFVLLGFLLLM